MSAVSSAAERPEVRSRTLSPRLVLAAIVGVSTIVEAFAARLAPGPTMFPDEYLYSQLARSLATTGKLGYVRGVNAHFLPMLAAIVTAPAWLFHDVMTSYRISQIEGAFAMSLTAVPVYLIAKRIGARPALALGAAAFAVAGPQMVFTSFLSSESYAYPLTFAVIAASIAAIERPSTRAQVVLLALSGLAAFDRLQLAALPLCAAAAVVLVGLRERRFRRALREQWLLLGVVALGALGGLAYILIRGLGYYHLAPKPAGAGSAATLAGVSVFVIAIAAGAAIIPSSIVGYALGVARPRSRAELAFAVLGLVVSVAFVVQCVLWGDTHYIQERYLGYLIPLLGIAFVARWSRSERRALPEVGVAAIVAAVASLVPLNGYAFDSSHRLAPTLYAFERLQTIVHAPAEASAIFALVATALAAVGAAAAKLRSGWLVALVLSLAGSAVVLAGASSWSGKLDHLGMSKYVPWDVSWVDRHDGGKATMLVVGHAWNGQALGTLFWNPSVSHVVRMPGAAKVDWLNDPLVNVDALGVVRMHGKPLTGQLLVDASPVTAVRLADARPEAEFAAATLWRPQHVVRLAVVMNNRFPDGTVLRTGSIDVWSGTRRMAGWIELSATSPRVLGRSEIEVGDIEHHVTVEIPSGGTRLVRVRACGAGHWSGAFGVRPALELPRGWTSPLLSVARYVPDPRACS
jgi:hypothetical protein